jgi:hypothetical protein
MEAYMTVFGILGLAIIVCVFVRIRNKKKGNDWF